MSEGSPGIMIFAQLGLLNAVCLLGGLAAGWGVDQALGTLPLFLLCGLVVGVLVGGLATWREVRRYS